MALKRDKKGNFVIKNDKQLREACQLRQELDNEIEESGFEEMQKDVLSIGRAVGAFMHARAMDVFRFTVKGEKYRATKIHRSSEFWVAISEEIPHGSGSKALKDVLTEEQWNAVTRRVVDDALIDEAVRSGLIDEDTIKECQISKFQQPFAMFYDERD